MFTVPGVSRPVPYMPEGTCQESSRWLAEEFAELEYVEGVLIVFEGGRPIEWLEHAWAETADGQIADATIRPTAGVQWKYIVDGPEHEAERALAWYALRDFGPPVPFDYDAATGQGSVLRAQAALDAFYASQDGAGSGRIAAGVAGMPDPAGC
jgi:hypothetical protein